MSIAHDNDDESDTGTLEVMKSYIRLYSSFI
jgi:hypothetical protein